MKLPWKWLWVGMAGAAVCALAAILFLSGFRIGPQISRQDADTLCQDFYHDVSARLAAIPGYTILASKKSCTPNTDEGGATDYYFGALFRVTKSGNETTAGLKANIANLSAHYPATDYSLWIRNDAAVGGRPDTICVDASKQIQESGEVYNPLPPKHYTDYTEPGSLPEYAPCSGV